MTRPVNKRNNLYVVVLHLLYKKVNIIMYTKRSKGYPGFEIQKKYFTNIMCVYI
jgi:hypothetical protein